MNKGNRFYRLLKFLTRIWGAMAVLYFIAICVKGPLFSFILLPQLIPCLGAALMTGTICKNMEEDMETERLEQEALRKMEMEEESVDVQIELDDDDVEFYFKDEESFNSLVQMVIERAKEKGKEQGIEFVEAEEDVENEKTKNTAEENQETDGEYLGLIDDADYEDYEPPIEMIDDADYYDENGNEK